MEDKIQNREQRGLQNRSKKPGKDGAKVVAKKKSPKKKKKPKPRKAAAKKAKPKKSKANPQGRPKDEDRQPEQERDMIVELNENQVVEICKKCGKKVKMLVNKVKGQHRYVKCPKCLSLFCIHGTKIRPLTL